QPLFQLTPGPVQLGSTRLGIPGCVDGPGVVTKVALDLPGDGGQEIADEGLSALRGISADRLGQPDLCGLPQVVQLFATAAVAAGDAVQERLIMQHDAFT